MDGSIIEARSTLENKLSPSLRRDAGDRLSRIYSIARKRAALELAKYGEHAAIQTLPTECPYTIDQIIADDWYPESPADPTTGAPR